MKNTILVLVTLVGVMVAMVAGGTTVDAYDKQTALETAKQSARVLYGVKNSYEKGNPDLEQRFMRQFKKQDQLHMGIKDKEMKKAVKKIDKVIIKARVEFNSGQKKDAIETIINWFENDYEKTIDVLYNK